MKLTKGLKFIQDKTIKCEVVKISTPQNVRGKKQAQIITISKNGKNVVYDLKCFQKSFTKSLDFKTKSFEICTQ